ncbi:uncharacterized protein [Physcomitrium patens]
MQCWEQLWNNQISQHRKALSKNPDAVTAGSDSQELMNPEHTDCSSQAKCQPKMTLVKKSIAAARHVDPLIYVCIILILLGYMGVDVYTRRASEYDPRACPPLHADASAHQHGKLTRKGTRMMDCGSIEGHLPLERSWLLQSGSKSNSPDAWRYMKWIGKPARCRVKGHLIEALDDVYNFRRGYALKYVADVEDKTHILPWLLGNRVDLNLPRRRVLMDLGGNRFDTSVTWFNRMYPCDFTEVHVFEIDRNLFKFPKEDHEEFNGPFQNSASIMVRNAPPIPKWMIDRMKLYNVFVSDGDDPSTNALNITRFMTETLDLKAADTVVVKMDIEGSEWSILKRWMANPEIPRIVDELFVEIHYSHESMDAFGWQQFKDHTRDDATRLLAALRSKGFFVHAWPSWMIKTVRLSALTSKKATKMDYAVTLQLANI